MNHVYIIHHSQNTEAVIKTAFTKLDDAIAKAKKLIEEEEFGTPIVASLITADKTTVADVNEEITILIYRVPVK